MASAPTVPPPDGLERIDALTFIPRHRHAASYVAIVLAGAYCEIGDAGRFSVKEGDILAHTPFEAHRDEVSSAGAEVLNLPCPKKLHGWPFWRISDPTALAALAQRDPREAQIMLAETAVAHVTSPGDWQDQLAAQLRTLKPFALADWAKAHGFVPESISRGFARAYGVTPHVYRAEARARLAIPEIMRGARPLAAIAAELGFSDQSHMTRAVQALSGHTPGLLRRKFGRVATNSSIRSSTPGARIPGCQ